MIAHRLQGIWIALVSSMWFVPGIIVLAAVVLALALIEVSAALGPDVLARYPRLFGAGAAGSRGMLSTIAGSMITVAGVTFSITVAALAQASMQYTPRVLRTFMGDRANQIVLGIFVGVFSYCLVVLRTIRGGDEGAFVPSVAVLGGFALALLGVAVLIYFIHHIAAALQAAAILDRVRLETEAAIDRLFPPLSSDDATGTDEPSDTALSSIAWRPVASPRTGYVQRVDVDGLLEFARERGSDLRMDRSIGEFVIEGTPLASLAPSPSAAPRLETGGAHGDEARALAARYTINAHRTVEQDPAFGMLQIADIALKALSPSVNDTTTAVTCVHHLGALLVRLGGRRIRPPARRDADGIGVIAVGPTYRSLVSAALDDVTRSAEGNVTVLGALLEAIEVSARAVRMPQRRAVLAEQLARTAEIAERTVGAAADRAALSRRAASVGLTLGPAA